MAKVLIVLDGGYRFSATDNSGIPDFTYEALVGALEDAGHELRKAHRQTDTSADMDLQGFTFDSGIDLLQFDVMWLIGLDGRNVAGTSLALPEPELAAIARFMEAGGGVFATGDHDSIGSDMCGHILRVRAMRCWYGQGDTVSPMDPAFPRNFPPTGLLRADTTRRNPAGDYSGGPPDYVWFENQSDSVPQTITHAMPTHPVLRRPDGTAITVYPDHMHEGNTLGVVAGFPYDTSQPDFDGTTFVEFPEVDGNREMPRVIATGQSVPYASKYANSNTDVDPVVPDSKTINTLSAYDGRAVGVGRIVTGATFHHYVDINLTGDVRINTMTEFDRTGPDAAKTHGFNDAPAVFADIKQVFANITEWLARPRPKIQIILERSTFSESEATADPNFAGAIRVYVDGLKPGQFPGGGIDSLLPADFDTAWAPVVTPLEPAGLSIVATGVDSDDPGLHDRLQRITFTYRVQANAPAAFTFPGTFNHVQVDAALTSAAVAAPLTDSAQITLVKAANPFMLDLENGNDVPWLSSDLRVFHAIAGENTLGKTLAAGANRTQALDYLRAVVGDMTATQFENDLDITQPGSVLSSLPTTSAMPIRNIYNFAIARVRVPATGAPADDVRLFFRIFRSQTTAALTYNESPPGTPIEGYKKTAGANPIALPGTNGAGTSWLSFPMFSATRAATPDVQTDPDNLKDGLAPGSSTFYGALIDTNLDDDYLPSAPGGGTPTDLRDLLTGEHQCIVAQIEYAGTPIPNGANPFTSDKLAQRNLALSPIANPGLDASRTALHTFEIEATPHAIAGDRLPDELLLDWDGEPPEGTEVRLYISSWDAEAVVALADRFYPRHEIRAVDAHTVALPGGGVRYVPIPASPQRQTGIVVAGFPLGVKKGQRYDLSVRQVTTRGRLVEPPPPKLTRISREEAERLVERLERPERTPAAAAAPDGGVFDLGDNRILVTDLRVLDAQGDDAIVVEHPEPEAVEAARRQSGRWRETIGAFQLGIPVSDKADMLAHHVRLLSVFRWRTQFQRRNSGWYETLDRYVDLIADKVRALGGDPWSVPATPDGNVPLPGGGQGGDTDPGEGGGTGETGAPDDFWRRHCPLWLALLILLLLLILLILLLVR